MPCARITVFAIIFYRPDDVCQTPSDPGITLLNIFHYQHIAHGVRKEMLRVLIFATWYLPGFKAGGPIRTIANMVDRLGHEFDFRIVTADRDFGDERPYSTVSVNEWNTVGNAQVYYVSPKRRTVRHLARLLRETPHDVLYLNSFFDPVFSLRPLLARRMRLAPCPPCVIAPRGEFSKGALALKSWKKRPFIALSRLLRLHEGLLWQASTEHEAADIRREMGALADAIAVAPDLTHLPPLPDAFQEAGTEPGESPLRLCFLSRISPMKNLDFALLALRKVSARVHFAIIGPVEDEAYWRSCEKLMAALPANVTVEYRGSLPPEAVPAEFAKHDLFFFPTRGENFGHVVFEALSAGTPVLISDQTPWAPDALGACEVLPLTDSCAFARAIDRAAARSSAERHLVRKAAREYAERVVRDDSVLAANRALFLDAAKRAKAS